MLIGFIHNRRAKKNAPTREFVGARMIPLGDEERMSVIRTYVPAVRTSVTGITFCAAKVDC